MHLNTIESEIEDILVLCEQIGIEVKSGSWKSLAEEAPGAYKDVDEVIKIVDAVGLSKKVVRLKLLIVIKG